MLPCLGGQAAHWVYFPGDVLPGQRWHLDMSNVSRHRRHSNYSNVCCCTCGLFQRIPCLGACPPSSLPGDVLPGHRRHLDSSDVSHHRRHSNYSSNCCWTYGLFQRLPCLGGQAAHWVYSPGDVPPSRHWHLDTSDVSRYGRHFNYSSNSSICCWTCGLFLRLPCLGGQAAHWVSSTGEVLPGQDDSSSKVNFVRPRRLRDTSHVKTGLVGWCSRHSSARLDRSPGRPKTSSAITRDPSAFVCNWPFGVPALQWHFRSVDPRSVREHWRSFYTGDAPRTDGPSPSVDKYQDIQALLASIGIPTCSRWKACWVPLHPSLLWASLSSWTWVPLDCGSWIPLSNERH